ncbi:MAG: serine/threonine-protein phosphatase [Lachnospiraceae bacterium]|nr:serine/threonine-protein phosphatase [Lachnospiraceae bacterium]
MNVMMAAVTDVGIQKKVNQDSLLIQNILTSQGRMVFAVLCDGMGGFKKGEVASKTLIQCFRNWVRQELPTLCRGKLREEHIWQQWEGILTEQNQKLRQYGKRQGIQLGTTVVVMLLTEKRYYIMNVGDSRAYQLKEKMKQLTTDQTFVADAVAKGYLTEDQAREDFRRHILLQCCGASDQIVPERISGITEQESVYLLCSDGFYHQLSVEECYELLQPRVLLAEAQMRQNAWMLMERCKQRQEKDNISVVLVKLCGGRKDAGKRCAFGWKI